MNHRGELELLSRILAPDVVLYTRIAAVHTEFLGGLEGVIEAKGELAQHMAADGVLVLNHDDPNQRSIPGRAVWGVRVVHYGLDAPGIRYEVLEDRGLLGCRVALVSPDARVETELRIPGLHQAENLAAAAAGAWALGVGLECAAEAAGDLRAGAHRGELIRLAAGVTVLDDAYNASPVAVERMLDLLSRTAGRRVAVLGGMYELGPESEEVHRRAGAQAAAAADLVVAVGSPHGDWIAEGAAAAGLAPDRLMRAADADAAGPVVASVVEPGDVVLLKASRGVGLERVVDHLGEVG